MRYLKNFNESIDKDTQFIEKSKEKYKTVISDVKDILLELSDSDIQYVLDKYLDDVVFEIQISINSVKDKDKFLVEETILRLNDYLLQHDLQVLNIQLEQHIETVTNNRKESEFFNYDFYSIDELTEGGGLSEISGILSISIYFGEHS